MGIPIAYTFSSAIQEQTREIDQYRQHILALPLSPRKEIELRYTATIRRILIVLREAAIPMTTTELTRLFANAPKRPHPIEREALLYRQALSYLREEWTGSTRSVSVASLEILMHVSLSLTSNSIFRTIRDSARDLKRLFVYTEAKSDHPILIAGVTHAVIACSLLHERSHGRMAYLTSSLILAKYGYDCRGMLNVEEALVRDRHAYAHALTSIQRLGQMTVWLEYYTRATLDAYTALLEKIGKTTSRYMSLIPPLTTLNDRQKEIIMLLDAPVAKITNREVQKRFRISQITASRDLTKLVSYGFLISSGKGRSVYYTLA